MPSPVQEGLSHTDKQQEVYRGYLVRRVLPAVAATYSSEKDDAEGVSTGSRAAVDRVGQGLAMCSTARLEACLVDLYEGLLMVRGAEL